MRDCLQVHPSQRPSAAEVAERLARLPFASDDSIRSNQDSTLFMSFISNTHSTDDMITSFFKYAAEHRLGTMINAVNDNGETALMLAKNDTIRKCILQTRYILGSNAEPSTNVQYAHGIDMAFNLSKMLKAGNIEQIEALESLMIDVSPAKSKQCTVERAKPLHEAIALENVRALQALLRLRVLDVNSIDEFGQSSLHHAAVRKHCPELAKTLLAYCPYSISQGHKSSHDLNSRVIYPNLQDNNGKSALHVAAEVSNIDCIVLLLSRSDIDVNLTDVDGRTALHISASINCIASINHLLLCTKTQVNVRDGNGQTALHLALVQTSFEAARTLLTREDVIVSFPDRKGFKPLHALAQQKIKAEDIDAALAITDMIVSRVGTQTNARVQIRSSDWTALQLAAENNNITIAKALVASRYCDVNVECPFQGPAIARQYTTAPALHIAAGRGYIAIIDALLVREDIDANARKNGGFTVLHRAAYLGQANAVRRLLMDKRVNVNAVCHPQSREFKGDRNEPDLEYLTALHLAVEKSHAEVVRILLPANDISVNCKAFPDRAPLCIAVCQGPAKIVEMLLSHKDIDVNFTTHTHKSLLLVAVEYGHVDVVRLLLKHDKVDIVKQANSVSSPIFVAAALGHVKIVDMLLSHNEIDCVIKASESALLHTEIVKEYLSHANTDVNYKKCDGKSLLVAATERGDVETAKVLTAHQNIDTNDVAWCRSIAPFEVAQFKNGGVEVVGVCTPSSPL